VKASGIENFLQTIFDRTQYPNAILKPDITLGHCWLFAGQEAKVWIKLAQSVIVSAFTIEHIPKSIALGHDVSRAPRKFRLYGVLHELEEHPR